ncbi:MAG: acetyl-CoA C-acyltransferase [bacterium]|nr:acetyl-CoA C-acyltransferase [bacterium]MBU1917473.1 acetyl-CoA C-acyltransferase [bacterium]
MNIAYIIDTIRTPRAKRKGSFSNIHPVDLAAIPITEIINRNNINPSLIEDVIMGCVAQRSEQDNDIARKAILAAGLPESIPGITVNRFCGSALSAINWATHSIMSGMQQLVLAGGVEHMTRVPMELDFYNGTSNLNKNYPNLLPQGLSAELIVEKYGFTRQELDAFSAHSQEKASLAWSENRFSKSIIPIENIVRDEHMRPGTTCEQLAKLDPVFKKDGVITAGNASGIVDGAATVLMASDKIVTEQNLKPRAKIIATATIGSDPVLMLLGPIYAIQKALSLASLTINDIDLFEINEAFAPVPMAVCKELGILEKKVNVNGGAIALGHPLGATGAMLLGTLVDELERQDLRYGLVTLCTAYGMAVATIIDRHV